MSRESAKREPLIVDASFITVEVSPQVASVIRDWLFEHLDDLDERLRELGLDAGDLALPEWHRLVYVDEVTALAADVENTKEDT